MLKTLKGFWKDERGFTLTIEQIGLALIIGGAVAMIGYGLAAAMRGLAGKDVLIIKCADPAYSADSRCDTL